MAPIPRGAIQKFYENIISSLKMKIGLIQTRGLGDILIATPIAMYYIERNCEVFWPIDSDFIPSFSNAFPKINFIPINKEECMGETEMYFLTRPKTELQKMGCDTIIVLYSHLTGFELGNRKLFESVSFDAYKYIITKVPFSEKWNFYPRRNIISESRLFNSLNLDPNEEYIVIHQEGSNFTIDIEKRLEEIPTRKVLITPISNNIFDWIGVLECSKELHLIDSVYANLVEQLNIKNSKYLYLRSDIRFTPTFINNWNYI